MTKKEKTEEKIENIDELIKDAFRVMSYRAYVYFYFNRSKVEESEAKKRAFEFAKEGLCKALKDKKKAKNKAECEMLLEKYCCCELLRAMRDGDTKLKLYESAAEKVIKLAEKLPPSAR